SRQHDRDPDGVPRASVAGAEARFAHARAVDRDARGHDPRSAPVRTDARGRAGLRQPEAARPRLLRHRLGDRGGARRSGSDRPERTPGGHDASVVVGVGSAPAEADREGVGEMNDPVAAPEAVAEREPARATTGAPARRPVAEDDLLSLVWIADPQIAP